MDEIVKCSVVLLILLAASALLFWASQSLNITHEDNRGNQYNTYKVKLEKEYKRVIKLPYQHGELLLIKYYNIDSYSNTGETYEISKDKNSYKLVYTVIDGSQETYTYRISKDDYLELEELAKKNNLPEWSTLKIDDEDELLDGPNKSLVFFYNDIHYGKSTYEDYNINTFINYPDDGNQIIDEYVNKIISLKNNSKLISKDVISSEE